MEYRIENCANSALSALKAAEGGAYRVELCAGIPEGGTTPSYGEIKMARKYLNDCKKTSDCRLHVIIRPRGGDFLYSDDEIEIMVEDILMAKELGADGIAVGCLAADGRVDMDAMSKIMDAASEKSDDDSKNIATASKKMDVTFHRAFDVCRNWEEALEDIISLGCSRILTSGQKANAYEGIPNLKELVERANDRIIIMPGCGVNPQNIKEIAIQTGAQEFHFSGRSSVESQMKYRNPMVSMGGTVRIEEYSRDITDPQKIASAIAHLK